MEVTLKHEVVVGGTVKFAAGSKLSIRRPKAKDMIAIGDHLPALAALDQDRPEDAMNSSVFKAMVAIAATLTDIGEEAALELDFDDLVTIGTEAFAVAGEAQGRGEAQAGA